MTASVSFSCSKQAITLKTPAKGLSDGSDPIRQHGVQGQVWLSPLMCRAWLALCSCPLSGVLGVVWGPEVS